jgi:hypothetical protein
MTRSLFPKPFHQLFESYFRVFLLETNVCQLALDTLNPELSFFLGNL